MCDIRSAVMVCSRQVLVFLQRPECGCSAVTFLLLGMIVITSVNLTYEKYKC